MQIFSITVQKGGIGKTTTAAILTQAAAHKGYKTLAVDLDPQRNLSYTLAADTSGAGSYELLEGKPAADLIQHKSGYDVIPASADLATIKTGRGSARRLQKALEPVKNDYDLIFIDTPGAPGELMYNALQTATGIIIPLWADSYSLTALHQTMDTVEQIRASNPELSFAGCLFTMYDPRPIFTRQMQKTITDSAAQRGVLYLGTVRAGIAIKEAEGLQMNIYQYAPRSNPAADYMKVFNHITSTEKEK